MSKKICRILSVCICLFCGVVAYGQTGGAYGSFSPYSIYGIGNISKEGTAYNKSMGGVGIATRNRRFINILNPASLTARDTLSFMADFGLAESNTIYRQNLGGAKLISGNNTFNIHDFDEDESFPRVDILISHADDDDKLVDAAVAIGAKGIVFAGLGNGCIPDKVLPGLVKASQAGVRVVRSSRVFTGAVFNGLSEWEEAGLISSWNLSAVKARVLLQLALKKGITDVDTLRTMFKRY